MKKIHILHVLDSLNLGGTERQAVEIAKGLDKEKFTVQMAALNQDGPLRQDLLSAGIPLTEFKMGRGFYSPSSLFQIFRLAGFMRKEKFDIVQTYDFYSTVPGVIAAKLAGVPVILSGRRCVLRNFPLIKKITEKFLWKFCHKVVVNAHAIRDYLIGEEGVDAGRVAVIHNGVHLFKPAGDGALSGHEMVGMVANFNGYKDHKTFLDAAALVTAQRKHVQFVLVGEGPLKEEVRAYAKDLGLAGNTLFYGTKTGEELYNAFRTFSVFVLSSPDEGFPNVILEAMALGIPVIASSVGGIPEVVEEGINGYLFTPKRADLLAEKILYLLAHPEIAAAMGRKGLEKVHTQFEMHRMVGQYEHLYAEFSLKK